MRHVWTSGASLLILAAAALSGASSIDIASATGMTDGDYLGV